MIARSSDNQTLEGSSRSGEPTIRDEALPLVVETNSEMFHTTPTDQAADELRYERLMLAGFTVAVVWEHDLWKRSYAAIETVREGRRLAAAGQPVVVHSPGCPWTAPLLGSPAAIDAARAWDRRLAA